jgi:hypothetical protein
MIIPTSTRHHVERRRLETVFRQFVKGAFDKPVITTGRFLENGVDAGSVLVASEGERKSVQVLPNKPNPRRGDGWGERW